jgi:hypothetical protein
MKRIIRSLLDIIPLEALYPIGDVEAELKFVTQGQDALPPTHAYKEPDSLQIDI